MKPSREMYLSFSSCSFFSAQSSFVSMALVYSMSLFIIKGEAVRSAGYKSVNVCIVEFDGVGGVVFFV